MVRLDVDAMNARDLVICWRVIGKARVAQAGSDGDDSPVPYVLHEGDLAQPLRTMVSWRPIFGIN